MHREQRISQHKGHQITPISSKAHGLDGLARREALDDAVAQFQAALARDSTYARAHFALGNMYEQRQEPEAALDAYEAFLRHWKGEAMRETVRQRILRLQAE